MNKWGIAAGVTAASIWGGMYLVSKVVLDVIPPFMLLSLRLGIAILVLGIVMLRQKGAGLWLAASEDRLEPRVVEVSV